MQFEYETRIVAHIRKKKYGTSKAWDDSQSGRFIFIYDTGEYKLVHLTETRSLGVLTKQVQSVNLYHFFFHLIVYGMSLESLTQRGGTKCSVRSVRTNRCPESVVIFDGYTCLGYHTNL